MSTIYRIYLSRTCRSNEAESTSVIHEYTPSALSAVLLSASKDEFYDFATPYAALRRHISNNHTDRYLHDDHVLDYHRWPDRYDGSVESPRTNMWVREGSRIGPRPLTKSSR